MISCHYHLTREGVIEVVKPQGSNHFICSRCGEEDSALEAEVREAVGKCQECGCEADSFTKGCDHCETYMGYMNVAYESAYETRYERQQLAGDN